MLENSLPGGRNITLLKNTENNESNVATIPKQIFLF